MTDAEKQSAEAALRLALEKVGGGAELARQLDISRAAVSQWTVCPAPRCADVERISGVPRQALRPDVFR